MGRTVHLLGGNGDPTVATDGRLLPEGAPLDARAIALEGPASALLIDLGSVRSLGALLLQAGGADVYFVEGTSDGSSWTVLWRVPALSGVPGLRTREVTLSRPFPARWLRVRATTARSPEIAEVQAFEGAPSPWPRLDLSRPDSRLPLWPTLTRERVAALQGAIAAAFLLVAGWGALPRRAAGAAWEPRARRALLLLVAGLSLFAWPNFMNFHYYGFAHNWELAHYYLGAKYLPELGYTRLYACAAVVDWEDGLDLGGRLMRDLRTNERIPAERERDRAAECHSRFSGERWQRFRNDARFFREQMGPEVWIGARNDHGFNGTPAWAIAGAALASTRPASPSQIRILALVDVLLIAATFAMIAWAFGFEAACIAAGYWGVNTLAPFGWTGGGFLRYDWLLWLVAGVALLRKRHPGLAGFALGYSTLLRIFPGCALVGLALKTAADVAQERSLAPLRRQLRFAGGLTLAGILFIGGSILTTGRPGIWGEFAQNSRKHLGSMQTNGVGLTQFLAYRHDGRLELMQDPLLPDHDAAWATRLAGAERELRPVHWLAVAAYLFLLALAVRGRPDWVAAVLGLGSMSILFALSTYYCSAYVAFGALASFSPGVGFALALLTWGTNVIMGLGLGPDEQYAWLSLAVVVFVVGVTSVFGWARRASGRDDARAG